MNKKTSLNRRAVLGAIGLSAAAGMLPAQASEKRNPSEKWHHVTDVLCIGSGAAACSAAISAFNQGAEVMLLEKMPLMGGTTAKSGGVAWICNHRILREQDIDDKKADAIAYMAHYSFPQRFNPHSPTLGLDESDYRLIEAFYDNGYKAIDFLEDVDAVKFQQFRLFQVDVPAPDYADHLPENKVPTGRALEPAQGSGASAGGGSLAAQMEGWLAAKGVPMMTDTRVTRILKENDRVIGVEALSDGKTIRIRANKGVVFGTGGYAHNEKLVGQHQTALYGACAMPGSTGDFIALAGEVGAQMGALHTAWRTQVLFEEALNNRALGLGTFVLPGDSMIVVNKYGNRVMNEKRCYNDRTQTHFVYDPAKGEYPNQLMFMLFDKRSIDLFGGNFPFPLSKDQSPYLIKGETWDDLFANINTRLKKISSKSGGVVLEDGFNQTTKSHISRFNEYAQKGEDPEFERGKRLYDTQWHKLFSFPRKESLFAENSMPNITMHPFNKKGPYYAFILAAGALDTNAGPKINEKAQVLDHNNVPIKGLYGAGNCIASPSRSAYYGAGGTIGLALTYGYIAGNHVTKG